jgi:hypothetical protein
MSPDGDLCGEMTDLGMLLFLYIAGRLAAFVMIVCLGLAIGRARSAERRSSIPFFLWAVVFLAVSAFLAIL